MYNAQVLILLCSKNIEKFKNVDNPFIKNL